MLLIQATTVYPVSKFASWIVITHVPPAVAQVPTCGALPLFINALYEQAVAVAITTDTVPVLNMTVYAVVVHPETVSGIPFGFTLEPVMEIKKTVDYAKDIG